MSNLTETRFYHYCYVCNTQLNSCKQALLHCSGKRHRKKLRFLQTRRSNISQLPVSPASIGSNPNGLMPITASPNDASPMSYTAPPPNSYPPFPLPFNPSETGSYYSSHPTATNSHTVYPIIFGAPAAGLVPPNPNEPPYAPVMTSQTYLIHPNSGDPQLIPPPYIHSGPNASYSNDSLSSSPLFLTDLSYSSIEPASSNSNPTRSQSPILSPSELSSISTESIAKSGASRREVSRCWQYKCDVCNTSFQTSSDLRAHLKQSGHFLALSLVRTPDTIDESQVNKCSIKGDRSFHRNGELWHPNSEFMYCSVCHISNNAKASPPATVIGAQGENVGTNSQNNCRTSDQRLSSDSSESTSESGPPDSGYLSSSSCRKISQPDVVCVTSTDGPISNRERYHCQLCDIYLNSESQAKQHINSSKHKWHASGKQPSMRRKTFGNNRKKPTAPGGVGAPISNAITPTTTTAPNEPAQEAVEKLASSIEKVL